MRTLLLCLVSFLTLGLASFAAPSQRASAGTQAKKLVFLPALAKTDECSSMQPEELKFAQLMRTASGQQRGSLTCNNALTRAARLHAANMQSQHACEHVLGGIGPNERARRAGYSLAYGMRSLADNNIESIVCISGGTMSADAAWKLLADSPAHRPHVLATDSFYQPQVELGLARTHTAPSYWVLMTAFRR